MIQITQRYEMTKHIRRGGLVYKCVACGEDRYFLKGWQECIWYPMPYWIKNNGLCSGGVCSKAIDEYLRRREHKT